MNGPFKVILSELMTADLMDESGADAETVSLLRELERRQGDNFRVLLKCMIYLPERRRCNSDFIFGSTVREAVKMASALLLLLTAEESQRFLTQ